MRVLYIGDIMGAPGRRVVKKVLPDLRSDRDIDLVIAQAENVSHGKGITPGHMKELQDAGVDVFSGGNHSLSKEAIAEVMEKPDSPIIRPINMDKPGKGHYLHKGPTGNTLVISLLGTTFPRSFYSENPLKAIDAALDKYQDESVNATVVNFHGDFSSDKRIVGYYLDGRVSAVVGDHWHIPTADAMILPGGTAHISDVGMCGTLHSSLGENLKNATERMLSDGKIIHDIIDQPPYQFNAVLVDINRDGLAKTIEQINLVLE